MSSVSERLMFSVHGSSVFLDRDNLVVARLARSSDGDHSAYVFTNRPFHMDESLIVRIHAFQELSRSVLGFGMTSCNPESLDVKQLPDDCDVLFDRPEYWVIDKTRFIDLSPGDRLHFQFVQNQNGDGEVKFSKNGQKPASLMFVDKTVRLWAFFELGNVAEMKILDSSSYHQPSAVCNNAVVGQILIPGSPSTTSNSVTFSDRPVSQISISSSVPSAQTLPLPGGRELGPLPPAIPPRLVIKQTQAPSSSPVSPKPLGGAKKSHNIVQLIKKLNTNKQSSVANSNTSSNRTVGNQTKNVAPPPPSATNKKRPGSSDVRKDSLSDECLVCMEKVVDCVLYTCGHMCLCFECAKDLVNRTNSSCPICRKDIADVIKTFKP